MRLPNISQRRRCRLDNRGSRSFGMACGWMSESTIVFATRRLVAPLAGNVLVIAHLFRWFGLVAWPSVGDLRVDHHVGVLDVHQVRLGDVGTGSPAALGLDRHVVRADRRLTGAEEGLAGLEVVLPAVPRAGDERLVAVHRVLTGTGGGDPRLRAAPAQRAALVGAVVVDRVEAVADTEDPD